MADVKRYRYFDLCIESELPLHGLEPDATAPPAWRVNLLPPTGHAEELDWFHTWSDPSGQPIMAAARREGRYLLQFFGLARFDLDFRARVIAIRPLEGCPDETLVHLLVDQVLPRAVCHEGRLVLHASAVALADGSAVAFSGVSGRGKSTLASAFFRAGYRVLSDDCLLLDPRDGAVMAVAAYTSMRLWSDSADSLFTRAQQGRLRASPMAHYTNKVVLSPESWPAAEPGAMPLRALYLLEPPGPLQLVEAGGTAAIMALVEAQFALDVVDRESVRRGFAAVQRIAGQVPVFRLAYPRDFRLLSEVIDKIVYAGTASKVVEAGEG
jgi:hypothetical protein